MRSGTQQFSSKRETVPASETTIKGGEAGRNDSDDSLLSALNIQVRKDLNVESQHNSITIDTHPRNW